MTDTTDTTEATIRPIRRVATRPAYAVLAGVSVVLAFIGAVAKVMALF